MNKNILILSASPRKDGNSDLLCDQFMTGAQESDNHVEKIFLRNKKINYCTGCGTCYKLSKPCPQKDDMPEILDKMVASDVIVMSTPVYFYTMNGQMKTLIDRCCSRYTEISSKEFYFIMTAADDTKVAMERTTIEFQGFTACLTNPIEKGTIYGTGVWHPGEIKEKPAMEEAYEMGKAV